MNLLRLKNIVFFAAIICFMGAYLVSSSQAPVMPKDEMIQSMGHTENAMNDCPQVSCSTMTSNAHCSVCFSLPIVISMAIMLPQKSDNLPQIAAHWQSIAQDPEIRPPIYS